MPTDKNTNLHENHRQRIKERFKGFYKELPWFYEKEFRILVEVKPSIREEIENSNDKTKLAIVCSSEIFLEAELMLAPENDIETCKDIETKIRITDSKMKVKMGLNDKLCKNCKKICKEENCCNRQNGRE